MHAAPLRYARVDHLLIVFLCLTALPAYGQWRFSVSTGLNFPSAIVPVGNDHSRWDLADLWKTGEGISAAAEIRFGRSQTTLVPSIEYAWYPFAANSGRGFTFTDDLLIRGTSGKPSRLYRVFLNCRYYLDRDSASGLFVSPGIGCVVENLGTIHVPFRLSGESSGLDISYPLRIYPVTALSGGMHIDLSDHFGTELIGSIFMNFNDRFHSSVNCGITYQ